MKIIRTILAIFGLWINNKNQTSTSFRHFATSIPFTSSFTLTGLQKESSKEKFMNCVSDEMECLRI